LHKYNKNDDDDDERVTRKKKKNRTLSSGNNYNYRGSLNFNKDKGNKLKKVKSPDFDSRSRVSGSTS
jgi:hypothetical protein